MTVINKIIHKFIRDRADYEENGELYYSIIPENVQAYSYELKEDGDPTNPNDYIIRYVLGTGSSTYMEIANGQGKDTEGNDFPELSKEFVVDSYQQLDDTMVAIFDREMAEKIVGKFEPIFRFANFPEASEDLASVIYQYTGETTLGFVNGYFYKCEFDLTQEKYAWKAIDVQAHTPVDQSYNSESANPQSGTAVAEAISVKVDKNADIVGATKTKITYDNKGLVTGGEDLIESDIPSIHLSKVSDVTVSPTEVNFLSGTTSNVQSQFNSITEKIPGAATSSNQLADKEYVNDSINNYAAYYITCNAEGDAFATHAALVAGPYYYDGAVRVPTKNDYAIVIADETKEDATSRYTYTGSQWAFQYIVNDTPFTPDQWNAINSGITTSKVSTYDSHVANEYVHVTINDKENWNNKVTKNNDITAATHTKITYDAKGLVTGGSDIVTADVTDLSATASEINQLHSSSVETADLTKLHDVTATSSELNTLHGILSTTNELNQLHEAGTVQADFIKLHGITADVNELNTLNGITSTTEELNQLHESGITKADLEKVHNVTATANELNTLHGITSTTAELNKLHDTTVTTTELNYVHGVTSDIQTQLNSKQPNVTGAASTITADNLTASKALISNENGKVAVSNITTTELGYLSGVSSSVQNQIDSKLSKTTDTAKLYGTDNNGNQYLYDYNTFGKVDDVKVDGTSVVTNKIANLGSMAGENKNDYILKNAPITGTTHTKITYDSNGLVTAGTDIVTADVTDLTATAAEINVLDGISATTAELNKLHGVTADTSELNILDGITASTTELNYVDGVTSSIQNQLDTKVVKTNTASQVYSTDANGDQTTLTYTTSNTASTIVERDANSQINVNLTPTADTHSTSKKYVDDKVASAITEAVVFKGVVADQTQLPQSGNSNGDLYWITAFVSPTPAGIVAGRSGAAIYKVTGSTGEWNYTQDAIYQPDEQTIKLNANGKLAVMVSTVANNAITTQTDGLHVDITGKVDKNNAITGATKTKITYDSKGLVTAGTDLVENDIPSLHLTKISDVDATAAEVNILHGATLTTTELNYVDGVTSGIQNQLDSKVAANTAITGATKTKITYDSKGLVTAGDDLAESDIPSIHLSKISDVNATAAEVNVLSGITPTTAELNVLHNSNISNADLVKLHNITASASELNTLTGITATTNELNYTHGVTSNIQTQLDSKVAANNAITGATHTKITYDSKGLVTSGADITLSDVTDVTATVAEVNVLDGITASTAELNTLTGITADVNELNILDGITASTIELNYLTGVTSNVQTQLDSKLEHAMVVIDYTAA